ncbi:4Fe-4S binding protein [Streptomyces sp. NPDC001833]|uniref:4Fe-4S binding protein n=1 Tax=Streptomyces sp. NPDC001833 TaxID=3154658 RepID=UPI0033203248
MSTWSRSSPLCPCASGPRRPAPAPTRRLSCGNCYSVCPDNAITKLGPGRGFAIDLDYCKGCGLCAAECPSGAIEMVPEE